MRFHISSTPYAFAVAAALLLNPHPGRAVGAGGSPDRGTAALAASLLVQVETPPAVPGTEPHPPAPSPGVRAQPLPPNPINPHSPDFVLILSFAGLTVGIVSYPIARYLVKTWAFRRDRLFGLLSGDAIVCYYRQFRPGDSIMKQIPRSEPASHAAVKAGKQPVKYRVGDPDLTPDDYMRCFSIDFHTWYGRKYYIAPVIGLFILSAASAWWCFHTLWGWTTGYQDNTRGLVATCLAGAFVWIISDEIDRLRRRDFSSSDVYYYVFRLLISIPFGWALTRLRLPLNTGIPIAFFLGAFPTSTLFTAARRIASEYLRLGEDPKNGTLELEGLPSVGKDNAERFKDEGITTITQLAYTDPVDLTIRTNFDFNYVIDCVSQALLWIYIPQSPELNRLSLRGAQEAAALVSWLTNADKNSRASATLKSIAEHLNIDQDALVTTLNQVALDPYTQFLVNAYSSAPASGSQASFKGSGAVLQPRVEKTAGADLKPAPVSAG